MSEELEKVDFGEDRNILVITTISCLLFGFIGPLISWLIYKDKQNAVAKSYLTNLLNFQLTLVIVGFVLGVLNIIPILGQIVCFLGIMAIGIINLVVIIIATVKLTNDQKYKFPITIELLK